MRSETSEMCAESSPDPDTSVAIVGAIAAEDVSILCARLPLLAEAGPRGVVVCDVGAMVANLGGVHALACLQLTARRLGCAIELRGASRELEGLLDLCGLRDVLPTEAASSGA